MTIRIVICSNCGSMQKHGQKCSICGAKVITKTEKEKKEKDEKDRKKEE